MNNFAVIGGDPWARIFLKIFDELESQVSGIEVSSIWTPESSTSVELAEEHDLKVFDDWENVISDEEIDLISICTSNETKTESSIKSLETGKKTLVSPPPAFAMRDLEELIRKAEKNQNRFKIMDYLSAAFPFQKAVEFKENNKFGRKMFTSNVSSLTIGEPERSLLEDAYIISGHMLSILDDVEKIFTWLPKREKEFHNKQNLTCIFVPEDKEKHGTWMNSYLPSLPAESELLGTEYLANYVGTRALAFVYGATGRMFENSPVSTEPGVYWIHWKNHEWESLTSEKFNYEDALVLDVLRFINKESDYESEFNPSKMRHQLLAMNSIITSMKRNGAPVKLEEAPSYISEIVDRED